MTAAEVQLSELLVAVRHALDAPEDDVMQLTLASVYRRITDGRARSRTPGRREWRPMPDPGVHAGAGVLAGYGQ